MNQPFTRVLQNRLHSLTTKNRSYRTHNTLYHKNQTDNMLCCFILLVFVSSLVPSSFAETCTMVGQANKKGKDSSGIAKGAKTSNQLCYDVCISDSTCVAATRKSVLCFIWTDSADIIDGVDGNFAVKQCTPDTTQTPMCTMDATANTGAANHAVEVFLTSLQMCQTTCQVLSECQRFVYFGSPFTCKLYDTAAVTSSAQSGNTIGIKKACSDTGANCCFDTVADQTISEISTLDLTSTLASCQEVCLAVRTCTGVIFTPSVASCKLFTTTPVATSTSGVTLYRKNCPAGASVGSISYTTACENKASSSSCLTSLIIFVTINIIRFL